MIDGMPEVHHIAVDPDVHLIKVPPPMTETPHTANSLSFDVACKEQAKAVPPQPHRLITTSRMISGEESKKPNGLAGLRFLGMQAR